MSTFVFHQLSAVRPGIKHVALLLRAGMAAIFACLMFAGFACAQSVPDAQYGRHQRLDVGAGFSGFDTDVDHNHPFEYGITAFVDAKVWHSLGIELEGRTVHFNEYDNVRQDTAMGGFRYQLPWRHVVTPYVKALGGVASGDFGPGTYIGGSYFRQHDTFSAMEFGGGADYPLSRRLSLRGEFDYEFWLDYGRGPRPGYGMTNPAGVTIAIDCHIL